MWLIISDVVFLCPRQILSTCKVPSYAKGNCLDRNPPIYLAWMCLLSTLTVPNLTRGVHCHVCLCVCCVSRFRVVFHLNRVTVTSHGLLLCSPVCRSIGRLQANTPTRPMACLHFSQCKHPVRCFEILH